MCGCKCVNGNTLRPVTCQLTMGTPSHTKVMFILPIHTLTRLTSSLTLKTPLASNKPATRSERYDVKNYNLPLRLKRPRSKPH